jgi:hypothetical protein
MQHRDRFSLLLSKRSVMAETAPALKKGALVRVNRQAYTGSVGGSG